MGALHHMTPMRSSLPTAFEFRLLNNFQRDFPLVPRPFAELGRRLDADESTVIEALRGLREQGVVSRIGAVFRPNVVGVSALAALAVAPGRLDEVAAQVSALAEINHNYQREHRFNLWFVATTSTAAQLHATLQAIEARCGCGPVLVLPLLEQFHIDLGFCLARPDPTTVTRPTAGARAVTAISLTGAQQQLVARLQQGIPLATHPFAALGWAEIDAIDLLSRWTSDGVISRFGVVVRHHELGYTANAMVVWDVPDAQVSQVGRRMAESGVVSLCYRRPRVQPHWPYNLFCMLHGKDRDEVKLRIAALADTCGLADYPFEILFSCRRFKQRGAQYVSSGQPITLAQTSHGPN